jgi:hypothetical protein
MRTSFRDISIAAVYRTAYFIVTTLPVVQRCASASVVEGVCGRKDLLEAKVDNVRRKS